MIPRYLFSVAQMSKTVSSSPNANMLQESRIQSGLINDLSDRNILSGMYSVLLVPSTPKLSGADSPLYRPTLTLHIDYEGFKLHEVFW